MELLNCIETTADQVGAKLLEYFGRTDVSARATPKEIKTLYDEITDAMIIKSIEDNFPDHSYLTEETGLVDKNSEFLWIVDPLDGTGNFVNNNPFFAVSISVWKDGKPLVSLIDSPVMKERYIAVEDESYIIDMRDGVKRDLVLSNVEKMSSAYLVYCEGGSSSKERVMSMVENLYPEVKGMRILGSAAMELMWVALGRAEAYITPEISIWDIAAGIHILKNAGGRISNFDLTDWTYDDLLKTEAINLVASNAKIDLPKIQY